MPITDILPDRPANTRNPPGQCPEFGVNLNTHVEEWVRQGHRFDSLETCPYCGQDTRDVALIEMYQSYFNTAYGALRSALDRITQDVAYFTDESRLRETVEYRKQANERLSRWAPFVGISLLDDTHDELAETSLANLSELLAGLIAHKSAALTEGVGAQEDLDEAVRLWRQYAQVVSDSNEVVTASRLRIEEFKTTLLGEDVAKIQGDLNLLDLTLVRHSEPVLGMIQQLVDGESKLKDAEKATKSARLSLTTQMTDTLTKYRTNLNTHLRNMGALFAIDEIKTNFLGSAPRTDYGISLRGKSVKLTGGVPSFATALSEGDKRTMAFAFFVASTLADPLISDKIVVVDDPMSSLDRSRREYTIELLVQIAEKSSQLIVMAHDATFLRDLRRALMRKEAQRAVSTIQISRSKGDYSAFDSVDLDRECESSYYTNYRAVDLFVQGEASDHITAAKALRPLIEGYLHRRYPGHIKPDVMLGTAIDQVNQAVSPSPLVHAKAQVAELQNINTFAGKFHHDTNPDFASADADEDSVLAYSKRAQALIHGAPQV
ncbi:AAA family ATPase [Subtercola boreus]|uniref:AAA family ATPase n=1 Tax=Subtercola boreus TaxID=120213 RepID=UPI00263BBFA6|nr:AAA family ATPase [Subtercola boreus]